MSFRVAPAGGTGGGSVCDFVCVLGGKPGCRGQLVDVVMVIQ